MGSFLQVYFGNRQEAQETALEASPIAIALQRLMQARQSWRGTATELLRELTSLVDDTTLKSKAWVGNPRSLGKALTRLAPDLRGIGIEVKQKRHSSTRLIQIDRTLNQTSQTSPMSQPNDPEDLDSDVSAQPVVTEWLGNVTSDKNQEYTWQTSPPAQPNVTLESALQQGFQQCSDNRDNRDIKKGGLSIWVGQQVKKRGKLGWFGLVKSVRGQEAEVLWQGDQYPESILVAELEAIAPPSCHPDQPFSYIFSYIFCSLNRRCRHDAWLNEDWTGQTPLSKPATDPRSPLMPSTEIPQIALDPMVENIFSRSPVNLR